MRRETQNILLVLVGGALLKISFTGAYLMYVKPAHQAWLIAGGLVMVLLAAVSIARDLLASRKQPEVAAVAPAEMATVGATTYADPLTGETTPPEPAKGKGHDHDDDHAGEHYHPARSAWLLLLPVLAIFLIAPQALGADSVLRNDNRAAATRASGSDGSAIFPAIPPGDVVSLPMGDFAARAAWDSGNSLDGRTVRLTGFIVAQGDDVFLARLSIACCAADAFPTKVRLDGPGTAGLTNDMWVEAIGQAQPGTATKETDYVPTLNLTEVSQIQAPENPYEQ